MYHPTFGIDSVIIHHQPPSVCTSSLWSITTSLSLSAPIHPSLTMLSIPKDANVAPGIYPLKPGFDLGLLYQPSYSPLLSDSTSGISLSEFSFTKNPRCFINHYPATTSTYATISPTTSTAFLPSCSLWNLSSSFQSMSSLPSANLVLSSSSIQSEIVNKCTTQAKDHTKPYTKGTSCSLPCSEKDKRNADHCYEPFHE